MKKERTNGLSCERARAFPIERALAKLGHFPTKTNEKEAWFLSPIRSETQASFKVSKKLNRLSPQGQRTGSIFIPKHFLRRTGLIEGNLKLNGKNRESTLRS